MNALPARPGATSDRDSGFSLIEVVVAIMILGILTTASLAFYVTSLNSAATIQRREVAITIANESLELVGATPVSRLYVGRSEAAVRAQWTANSAIDGVTRTYAAWDPSATGTAAVPLKRSVSLGGTDFTSETLIGTCYQALTGVTRHCQRTPASSSNTPLTRVIVVVRWTAGDSCGDGSCFYEATTLVDPNKDIEWRSGG